MVMSVARVPVMGRTKGNGLGLRTLGCGYGCCVGSCSCVSCLVGVCYSGFVDTQQEKFLTPSPFLFFDKSSLNMYMDNDIDHFCPNCRKRFSSSRGVQTHLNHKSSSCYSFLDDYDALSAFSQEDMRFRAQRAQERAQERAQAAPQNPTPFPPPPPSPISTEPPHINTTATEYHPLSSYTYGSQENTFERVHNDRFAHRRSDNPYYPFQGCEEWELARFLARSSLSQSEIDEFLKLRWVTSFYTPFPLLLKALVQIRRHNLSYPSAHAFRSWIESLPDPPRWYCEEITVEGYKSKQPIYFYWRDALEVIEYIFGNPVFAPYMQYDPQRVWTDTTKTERIYSEYMTGDFAWKAQV